MYDLLRAMRRVSHLPLICQANAGLPQLVDGKTIFPASPAEMTAYHDRLLELGVRVIGGCCGTTPAHIKAMRTALVGRQPGDHAVARRADGLGGLARQAHV